MNRLLFSKTGDAVYLSHLDLMRIFQRTFKRADILIWHSQGFSPRAYVSIALPLSVGTESRCEILDFEIEDGSADLGVLPERLNRTMPAGIRVLQAYESARKFKELAFLQSRTVLEYDGGIPKGAADAIRDIFERESIPVMKFSKNGGKEVDIKPTISALTLSEISPQELQIDCIASAQNPGLNPQLLVQAVSRYLPELTPDFSRICRVEVFDGQMQIFR